MLNPLVVRRRFLPLKLNVLLDHVISHISRARGEVAPCPKTPAPESAAQLTKLLQHPTAAPPLDPLHQLTYRHLRRYRDQQMHMVNRYVSTQDVHILCRIGLSTQLAQPLSYFASQHGFLYLVIHTK